MRRLASSLVIAGVLALSAQAAADQITNGSQPRGSVVGAKRDRNRGSGEATRAAAAPPPVEAAAVEPLHRDERDTRDRPNDRAPVGCSASASVICLADGQAVAGW